MDRYTKAVLTVIAVCLAWLCVWGPAPKWGSRAEAEEGAVDVNIASLSDEGAEGAVIPVEVRGRVQVDVNVVAVGGEPVSPGFGNGIPVNAYWRKR